VKAPWQRAMLAGVALVLVGAATTAQSLRFPGRIGASTPQVAQSSTPLPPPLNLKPCGEDARHTKIPLDATVSGHTLTFYEIGSCFVRTSNGVRWTIADVAPRVPMSGNGSADTASGRVTLSSGCDDTLGSAGETLPIGVGSAISFEAQVRTGSATCDISVSSGGVLPAAAHKSRKRATGLSLPTMIAIALAIVLATAAVFIARKRGWSVLAISRPKPADDESDDDLEETDDVYNDVDEALEAGLARALAVLDETIDPRTAVVTSWVQLEVALRDAKVVRRPSATSREFASEVLASLRLDVAATERLQRLYLDARYSQREITAEMRDEARDLVAALIVELRDRAGLVAT
jgi:hypothetical protein